MSPMRLIIRSLVIAGMIGSMARADAISSSGGLGGITLLAATAPSGSGPSQAATPLVLGTTGGTSASPSQARVNLGSTSSSGVTPSASDGNAVGGPSTSAPPSYDAFVNLGAGPFPDAGRLTNGNAQPWYDSPQVARIFGGPPGSQQISSFDQTVLQRVEQTFRLGGVPVALTDDPTATAAHTLSVVSNSSSPSLGTAIGMTNIGGNGFHFVDNSTRYAGSVDQLEWIVAHNVAHELMLAFGVQEVHDQTGQYIDSTSGTMALFLNPKATFSPAAVQDLLSKDFRLGGASADAPEAQSVDGVPVPEPATCALWVLGAIVGAASGRLRSRRAAA
jgi:hypothetical protein